MRTHACTHASTQAGTQMRACADTLRHTHALARALYAPTSARDFACNGKLTTAREPRTHEASACRRIHMYEHAFPSSAQAQMLHPSGKHANWRKVLGAAAFVLQHAHFDTSACFLHTLAPL
eukprot:6177892-Pleurochrysis_carterae.AAC.2